LIKEAIEKILQLSIGERYKIDGRDYSTNDFNPIRPPIVKPFTIHTLTGIIDYFKSPDGLSEKEVILHIESPSTLALFSNYSEQWKQRDRFLFIELMIGNPFNFGNWYDHEKFIIELQSKFLQTKTVETILAHIGNITDEHVKNIADDGVGQTITVRKTITRNAEAKVPNPVILQPYRTFLEIDQPESKFVFRVKQKEGDLPQCALFAADGGRWELEAIQNIKKWLEEKLPEAVIIA